MDPHSELELKWAADNVDIRDFLYLIILKKAYQYVHVARPDIYYKNGDSVVRHRHSEGAGELTSKHRKSATSITDRVEIDLKFADGLSYRDVEAFLKSTNWSVNLELDKDAHVIWVEENGVIVTLSIYKVNTKGAYDFRTFIEVEVEKSNDITPTHALNVLHGWKDFLTVEFGLDKPLNSSLYEIFAKKGIC